jgi:uncharacterized protein YggE
MRIALATLAAALCSPRPPRHRRTPRRRSPPTAAARRRSSPTSPTSARECCARADLGGRPPRRQLADRAILKAVKARGVADADIQTTGLRISRERVGRRGHRRVRYAAFQELRVRVRDVKSLGAMLDAVATPAPTTSSAPDFGFADPSQGRLLATRAALADARKRADDAAAQTGLRITGVRTVDVDPQTEPLYGGEDSSGSGGSANKQQASTRVEPGTQDFEARVRVVYTAAPAA